MFKPVLCSLSEFVRQSSRDTAPLRAWRLSRRPDLARRPHAADLAGQRPRWPSSAISWIARRPVRDAAQQASAPPQAVPGQASQIISRNQGDQGGGRGSRRGLDRRGNSPRGDARRPAGRPGSRAQLRRKRGPCRTDQPEPSPARSFRCDGPRACAERPCGQSASARASASGRPRFARAWLIVVAATAGRAG